MRRIPYVGRSLRLTGGRPALFTDIRHREKGLRYGYAYAKRPRFRPRRVGIVPNRPKRGFMSRLAYHFERYWQLWILVAPGLIFMFLFAYVPMWGIQLAFREFEPSKGSDRW